MQRRQEEEKKAKKEKAIIKTGCILAVIICVCIAAWKFYDNYQEKHGPYITVGDHEIQKAEFDYYYYSSLNSFASTYGSICLTLVWIHPNRWISSSIQIQ